MKMKYYLLIVNIFSFLFSSICHGAAANNKAEQLQKFNSLNNGWDFAFAVYLQQTAKSGDDCIKLCSDIVNDYSHDIEQLKHQSDDVVKKIIGNACMEKALKIAIHCFLQHIDAYFKNRTFSATELDYALDHLNVIINGFNSKYKESYNGVKETISKRQTYRAAFKSESNPHIQGRLLQLIHECDKELFPILIQFKNQLI